MNAAVVADPAAADGEEGAARRISNAPGLRAGPPGAPPNAKIQSALGVCSPAYSKAGRGRRVAGQMLGLLTTALLLNGPRLGHAEGGSLWRIYPVTAGQGGTFAVAVTVSPRGNVWVRQGGDGPASWLDGFQVRTIPFSGTGNFPVYESRSGQIWALFAGGVMEFRRDQWVQYPVAEISAEIQSSALRYVHPFPLLPAERDHVLALLPDRLLEYDASQGRTIVLRKVG